jgi:hypothetical protein
MGWTPLDSVVLNPTLIAYLDTLAARLPFDVVVTSGIRTPLRQARAMFEKIRLGDDLLAIYKDDTFAQRIIDAYPDEDAAAAIVEEYAAAGGGSTHLRGLGVDLRTRDKTPEQIETMVQTVESMGDFALVETKPPHLHISLKKNYTRPNPLRLGILAILGVILWNL